MKKIKHFILSHPCLKKTVFFFLDFPNRLSLFHKTKKLIRHFSNEKHPFIVYFGVPAHSNLGDLAQGVCIRRFLKKYYPNFQVLEIETNAIVNTPFSVLRRLKKIINQNDLLVFQSGYATTDIGGFADIMHKTVIRNFPKNRMVMMPQTILFHSEKAKEESSLIYNSMKRNMLFLARDELSYETAQTMFPDVHLALYPDIVTSLIGDFPIPQVDRHGILFCVRGDSEKFYSDDQISDLVKRCSSLDEIRMTDTTKKNKKAVVLEPEEFIRKEILYYSSFKCIVTDRYHGTIFSLIAGTPVVVLKTNDHKVTTGARWFDGIYDDYVHLSNSIDDAFELVSAAYKSDLNHKIEPFFDREYYQKLPALILKDLDFPNKKE